MKEEGKEGGQKGWPYGCLLPPADAQVLWDFSLGFQEGREDGNSALPETRDQITDQNQNSSSLPTGGDQALTLRSG